MGEQFDNQEVIEKITKVGNEGEWYYVCSENNVADRATRLNSVPDDLGIDSEWQTGPAYLKKPISEWPINRNFAERKGKIRFP